MTFTVPSAGLLDGAELAEIGLWPLIEVLTS
jgi:hypothetical protein